jgi:hypothetical protein
MRLLMALVLVARLGAAWAAAGCAPQECDKWVADGNTLGGKGWYDAMGPSAGARTPAGAPYEPAEWSELSACHAPVVRQLNASWYEALCGHKQIWYANGTVEHAVTVLFVRNESGAVVHYAELHPSVDRAAVQFSYRAPQGGQARLQAFAVCNLHGGWRGANLSAVDPASWDLTEAALKVSGGACTERSSNLSSIAVAPGVSFNSQLLDANRVALPMGSMAGAAWVQLTLKFPADSWLGVGFGDQMPGADVVLCAAVRGAVRCFDMFVEARHAGPRTDDSLGGSIDIEVVEAGVAGERASATVNKRLVTSDARDARISLARQNLIVAYHSVGAQANLFDGNSVAQQHGLEQRVRLVGVDLRLGAANVGGFEALAAEYRESLQNRSVHGIMMFLTWAVIIVVGAIVARYERHHESWLLTHRVLQTVGSLISLPGFVLTVDFHTGLTAHHVVGMTLLAWSYCQAICGTYIYHASLASTQFAAAADKGGLSERAKHIVAQLACEHGADSALRQVRLALERDDGKLSPQIRDELGEELRACARQHANCCASPRAMLDLLTMLALRPVRSFHRWSGRTLPLLAFAQIYLGATALRVSASVGWLMWMWCAIIAAFVVFKEGSMQYDRHSEKLKMNARALLARLTNSTSSATSASRTKRTLPPEDPPPLRDVGGIKMIDVGSIKMMYRQSSSDSGNWTEENPLVSALAALKKKQEKQTRASEVQSASASDVPVDTDKNRQPSDNGQHDSPPAAQAQPPQVAGDSGHEPAHAQQQTDVANILALA